MGRCGELHFFTLRRFQHKVAAWFTVEGSKRVLEEVSTQTRAAIAKLDEARSRLAALRERSQAEPQNAHLVRKL